MGKTGLVIEGGGMKGAYSAGVLDGMLEDDIYFDYVIGVSAGSANASTFVSRQRERCMRFFTVHLKDPLYFGVRSFLKTRNLFNLQYIYGTLSNSTGKDPISYPTIKESDTELVIVATDARTGQPHYFTKDDMSQDHYEIIMASSAIPVACRPQVIDGVPYYDGGISDAIPVQKALDDGCDKLVIALTKPHDYVKTPEKHKRLYSIACRKYPNTIKCLDNRHIMYNKCIDQARQLEADGTAMIFAPSTALQISTYTMDPEVEKQLYQLGLDDYRANRDRFLQFMGLPDPQKNSAAE